ncbi:MAG: AsnC family transcriptional regulator [Rhodospirillaceae bacterium]|nr:AsnC family transcriptional regulator [Rhodospirillaceae bacterium]OUT80363.1 MAG: AsnC family transcriptional regulator [Rhodospirillaceae bacterium TMED23]|tara:strand:- start:4270 stop:4512 length:243 start_codon:yes stop_codon:yes gene_type:complete
MQTLFVQVKCELGKVYDVAEQVIESVDKVSEIHSTSGQFDLLIKCYLDDKEDIGRFISDKIQPIDGVRDTYTIITFKAFS